MLPEKLAVVARRDEADVLAVGLPGVGEIRPDSQVPYLLLAVPAHGQQGMGKLLLAHTVQDVGLVLPVVNALEEAQTVGARLNACVVAGRYITGIKESCALEQEV